MARHKLGPLGAPVNLPDVGTRFGRLVVLGYVVEQTQRGPRTFVECMCDCGRKVNRFSSPLCSGKTRSCGCLNKDTISKIGRDTGFLHHRYSNEYLDGGDSAELIIRDMASNEVCRTTIDSEDIDRISKHYWTFDSHAGYVRTCVGHRKKVSLHQLLIGKHADHADQNKLNNRKANLRRANQSLNQANIGKRNKKRIPTSRFKGVCFRQEKPTHSPRWIARIRVNQQLIELGCFSEEIAAAKAYDAAAQKYFGEFACPNFPVQCASLSTSPVAETGLTGSLPCATSAATPTASLSLVTA
jgi:hypothetical protein